jgi:hypothetical protein
MLLLPILDNIENLFWRLQKRIDVLLKIGTYEFRDGKIIKNNGLWHTAEISTDEIHEWEIFPEMGFDVVILKAKGGQQVVWIDRYDDLVGVLRNHFRELEHPSA